MGGYWVVLVDLNCTVAKFFMHTCIPSIAAGQRKKRKTKAAGTRYDKVTIDIPRKKANGRRIWDKKHSCFYCEKDVSKMARHLEDVHNDERKVMEALTYPKLSKQRGFIFESLTRHGDYLHNLKVLHNKEGSLRVMRKPTQQQSEGRSLSDYGPCPGCYGFLIKSDLWRHCQKCEHYKAVTDQSESRQRGQMQRDSRLLLIGDAGFKGDQKFSSEVLTTVQDDDISQVAREDWLICTLGYDIFEQHGASQKKVISQSMRTMARFLQSARDVTSQNVNLEDMIAPEMFDTVVSAVHSLARRSQSDRSYPKYDIPSLALKVGNYLCHVQVF